MPSYSNIPQPTAYKTNPQVFRQKHQFVVNVPIDLLHLAEDQAQNSGMTLAVWLDTYCQEGLRLILCG
jgi:hypothetical protein